MQPPFQLPNLRVDSGREPDLRLLPRLRPLPAPHVPVFDILLVVLDLLDNMVIQWIQRPLERDVSEVGQVTDNRDQQSRGPVDGSRGKDLEEDPEGVDVEGVGQFSVDEEEEVPGGDAGHDQDVLDPREVAHGEGDLDVHGPDDACHHGGADGGQVGRLTPDPEGLVVEDDDVEEEDDEGGVEPVRYPPEDSQPVEEQILWPLLV